MDQAIIVLCALLLNAAIGGPRRWYAAAGLHRVGQLPGRALRHLERKLNRDHRSRADREFRGWVLVGVALVASIVAGAIGGWIFRHNLGFIEILLVAAMLPARPIWDRAHTIRACLMAGDIPQARHALIGTPWRHHALLDEHGLARAAIETTVVDFSEKLACPILGYLFFGLPGLFICKSITLMRDVLSHAPEFSKGARLAHMVLHTLPARLSAMLWLATPLFLPSGGNISAAAKRVLAAFLGEAPRPLCVHVASAVARVSLGGPTSPYFTPWVENGTAKARPADVRRAQAAYVFALVFLFIFTGAFF